MSYLPGSSPVQYLHQVYFHSNPVGTYDCTLYMPYGPESRVSTLDSYSEYNYATYGFMVFKTGVPGGSGILAYTPSRK